MTRFNPSNHPYARDAMNPVALSHKFCHCWVRMLWLFVFFSGHSLFLSPLLWAETDDWQVQRKDRQPILIRRFKAMLRSQPFSDYAFDKLWSMHRKSSAKTQLTAWYEQRVQQHAHPSDQIVLARLWERSHQWQKALVLYRKIPQPASQKQPFQLAEIRCLFGLKQPQQALRILQQIVGSIGPKPRRSFLQQALQQILASGSAEGLTTIQPLLQQETWNRDQKLTIARWFAQYHHWQPSLTWYEQAVKGLSGQPKMLLLLEIIRHQISARQFSQALATIETARAMKTRHSWLAWELLQQQVVIFRAQQQLPLLVAKLDRQWQHTQEEQKLSLLAELYDELKIPTQAIPLYLRILKRNPSAQKPRMRLLYWYSKQQNMDEMRHHLRLLIQYKHATPEHFLRFAKDLLKRSGRKGQSRWNPAWKHSYACQNNRRHRFYRNYIYGGSNRYYKNTAEQHRCSRQQWNHFRQQRWQYWAQHEASSAQKRMLTEAVRILEQCATQYRHQWDTLQQVESLLSQQGYSQIAHRVRQKMIQAVDAYIYQVEGTHRLLYQEEETQSIKKVAHNALRSRSVPLKRAIEVASHLYLHPLDPSIPLQEKTHAVRERQQKNWQESICPSIIRFLQPVWKQLQPLHIQQDPALALHLYALLQRCGLRSKVLQNALHSLEQTLYKHEEQRDTMLRFYLRYRLKRPLQRLFRSMIQEYPYDWLSRLRSTWRPGIQPRESQFFFKQLLKLSQNWSQQAGAITQLFARVCQYKTSCTEIRPVVEKLIKRRDFPMSSIISMLSHLQQHHILQHGERRDRLSQLISARRHKLHELQQLAEAHNLFHYPHDIQELHRALLIYVLEHRSSPPSRLDTWGYMLEQHLRNLRPTNPSHQSHIQRIDQVTSKFPPLYRRILSFYLTHYYYRNQYGPAQILSRFKTQITLDDLPLLEKMYHHLPYHQRQSFFDALNIPTDRPEILGWLYLFAKKFSLTALQIKVLYPLTRLRPDQDELATQLASALDRSNTHNEQAESFWLQWLRKKPHQYTLQAVQNHVQSCCADLADQRRTRRLLVLAAQTHGIAHLWKHVGHLLTQLATIDKRVFLRSLLQLTNPSQTLRIQLAELAQLHQLHSIAIDVYTPLVKQTGALPIWSRKLAESLDHKGNIEQANIHWRIYLQSIPGSQTFTFFHKLGDSLRQQNLPNLARLAYYRAWTIGSTPPADAETQILALQKSGKHLQAWSLWLATQTEKTYRCFSSHVTPSPSFHNQAHQLWQLRIPYQGPLALFPPCAWTLPQSQAEPIIKAVVAYLQKNPNISLIVTASADPLLEPNATFLAQQRAKFLVDALISQGIPDQRLSTQTISGHTLCTSAQKTTSSPSGHTSNTKNSILPNPSGDSTQTVLPSHPCSPYQRQVGLALKGSSTSLGSPYVLSLSQDSDRDGVPDIYDTCPLQSGKNRYRPSGRAGYSYGSYYYGRSPYGSRRSGVAILGSTASGISSGHSSSSHLSRFDCPLYRRPLQLLHIQDGILHLRTELRFYRQSSSIVYASHQTLQEIAALLRMVPALGVLNIHIYPHMKPSYDRSYYPSYRYRRHRSSSSWGTSQRFRSALDKFAPQTVTHRDRYLANQRARQLQNYLITQGVPATRIRTHVHLDKPKQPSGYIVLQFGPSRETK